MAETKNARTVLFVHHSNDLYGADVVLLETVKRLDRSRFAPFVVLPEDCRSEGGLAAELERLGVRFQFYPLAVMRRSYFKPGRIFPHLLEFIRAVTGLIRMVREQRVAIVHSNTLAVCAGAIAARITKTPHVWHVHEMLVSPERGRRAMHFAACRLSTIVVCISEAVRQHLLADQPKFGGRLVVVHDGLPLEDFFPVSDGSTFRQELGIPASAPFIGMVGRLNHWKGQVVFVHAAKMVLDRFPDAHFLVVGSVFGNDQHYLDVLKSEVERAGISGSFRICDFRRDVPQILSSLDVFVHPSLLPEPFGLVVIEAMAACRPVVATAHGGPLEMIEDGVSGHLVPPGDATALAGKIAVCLEDRASSRAMGKRGQERALGLFHVSRYIERIQAIYDAILEARLSADFEDTAGSRPGVTATRPCVSGRR